MIKFVLTLMILFGSLVLYANSIQVMDEKSGSSIDWTNSNYIAEGLCPLNSKYDRGVAIKKAMDYAKMEAIANLFMMINSTNISLEATGQDYMADVTIKQEIEGLVRNVKVTSQELVEEYGAEFAKVTVVAGIYGNGSAGSVLLKKSVEEERKVLDKQDVKIIEQPKVSVKTEEPIVIAKASAIPVKIEKTTETIIEKEKIEYAPAIVSIDKPYTGLIINALGFKLDRSMSLKIRLENGDIIWTGASFDFEKLADKGILSYANSIDEAKKLGRAGDNPLVIYAKNVVGNGKFRTDICITADDAAVMKNENAKSKFMDDFKIIVVSNY